MLNLIRCEFYKLRKSKKNWIIMLAVLLLTIGIGCYYVVLDHGYDEAEAKKYQSHSHNSSIKIEELTQQMLASESIDVSTIKEEIAFWNVEKNKLSLLKAYSYKEVKMEDAQLQSLQIERYDNLQQGFEKGYDIFYITQEEVHQGVLINQYLLEHNIESYHSPFTMNTWNFLYKFFSNGTGILLCGLLFFLINDVFAKEFEDGSYKVTYTSPYKRSTIVCAKVIASIAVSLLSVILSIILVALVFGLLQGSGSLQYPYFINGNIHLCGITLLKIYGFMTLTIIFTLTISILCSVFFKQSSSSILLSGSWLLLVYLLHHISIGKEGLLHALPTSYLYFEAYIDIGFSSILIYGSGMLIGIVLMVVCIVQYMKRVDMKGVE